MYQCGQKIISLSIIYSNGQKHYKEPDVYMISIKNLVYIITSKAIVLFFARPKCTRTFSPANNSVFNIFIGMSFGGMTQYSMNAARDLSSRIA